MSETTPGLAEHLARMNKRTSAQLVEQLRSPLGVIPFVGAGMSAPYGLPLWDRFLRESAIEFGLEDVIAMLDAFEYERAAERLDEHSPDAFTDRLAHEFGIQVSPEKLRTGALSYLPLLTTGPVITTNFDGVLESAFAANGRPLHVIEGPRDHLTVGAIHRNEHALLKIHGSFNDRVFRVFTKDEYARGYDSDGPNLTSLAWLTFTNRPLLFLGASLVTDRTVAVLQAIHAQLPALRHYAILAANHDRGRQLEREQELAGWGLRVIWYPSGQHAQITDILRDLVERAGSRERVTGVDAAPEPTDMGERFRRLIPAPRERDYDVESIATYVERGEVAFSLGSGAHLRRIIQGDAFYSGMSETFGTPRLSGDRSMVADFVVRRRGAQALWDWVRHTLDPQVQLSPVYELLVSLPGYLRARGRAPMWVFMTNYDAVLERALRDEREPFHLLYYMEHQGLFSHTAPDGSERVIDRPEAIRELRPAATVIVKLNGGIVDAEYPEESVVIATGQFERLAAGIPDVLPACVRTALLERHLLFLGHGLNEPDLKEVLRFSARDRKPAWILQQRPTEDRVAEWEERARDFQQLGAITLERSLEEFVLDLHRELADRR